MDLFVETKSPPGFPPQSEHLQQSSDYLPYLPRFNIISLCFLSEIVAIVILRFIILTQLLGKVNLPQVLAYFAEKTFQK